MSDIFREVDEEIRHERYKRLWDRFGIYIIGVAVLIVAGTAAYRGWIYWQDVQAQASGDIFLEAVQLAEDGSYGAAQERLEQLADATGGYPALARLRAAGLLAQSGDAEAAIAAFDAIAADTGEQDVLRDIARMRAGYLALERTDYPGIADRLEPLTGADSAWRFLASEALAFAAWRAGDAATARRWIGDILDQEGAPSDVTARVQTIRDLLNATYGAPADEAGS